MKEKDLDLLLALIEGRLAAGDEAAAQARVSSDHELQTELNMQRLMVARLHRLPRPSLSESERDRLHNDLRKQLHLIPPAPAVPAPQSRWWSRWVAISGLAAAAVVLIGLVYVIPRTGDQDAASEVVAVDVLETETGGSPQAEQRSAAEPEGSPDTVGADDPTAPVGGDAADGSEGGASAEPGTTLRPLAAEEDAADDESALDDGEGEGEGGTTATSSASAGTEAVAEAPPGDVLTVGDLGTDVPAAADLLENLDGDTADEQQAIDFFQGGATTTIDSGDLDACAASLGAVGGGRTAVPVATGTRGGEEVVVVVFAGTADAPFTVAIVATDGCEVVDSAAPAS